MTPAQEQHLDGIINRIGNRLGDKYAAGQVEHGGNIWAKSGLWRQLTDEVVDLIVYQDTIEDQLRDILALLRDAIQLGDERTEDRVVAAYEKLNALLNGACD